MTPTSRFDNSIGAAKVVDGEILVFGPDPWCDPDHGVWNCWFSLTQYEKDFGKKPPYVSDPIQFSLGL
jgi:hypothetical protein